MKTNISAKLRNRCKPKRGRSFKLNKETYKRMRRCMERFFAWLTGGFRRLA